MARFEGDEGTVRSLIASFSTKTAGQLDQLAPALQAPDHEQLREIAHSIKGSALSLSAERLGEAAARLEEAARDAAEGASPSPAEVQELQGLVDVLGGAFEEFRGAVAALD